MNGVKIGERDVYRRRRIGDADVIGGKRKK